jgi:hypothetical protein
VPAFADGCLRGSLQVKLTAQDVERRAPLGHVVVPVVVPCLNTGQAMRLTVASYFSTDAMSRKQRLDAGPDPLQLEAFDRVADDGTRPTRQRPHADGLLAGGRRDSEPPSRLRCAKSARADFRSGISWGRGPWPSRHLPSKIVRASSLTSAHFSALRVRMQILAQIGTLQALWKVCAARRRAQHDVALRQCVHTAGHAQRFVDQLLDQQHGGP